MEDGNILTLFAEQDLVFTKHILDIYWKVWDFIVAQK